MSRSLLDRRALFSSAAAAALLAATGVSAAGPKPGGRLRMALSGAARNDTWLRGDGLFMQIARQGVVFDTLTEIAADGTLRGELASGWTSSPDARVWLFELCRDVSFHDGAPFTAKDVVASAAGFAGGAVQAVGDHQVSFTLVHPDPGLPMRLAQPAYFIRAAHAPDNGTGTGLYKVSSFVPGQRLLATRVADHYKGEAAGWFDEVELTSIPSEPVRGQALGEYLVDAVDLTAAGALADLPDITLQPDRRHPTQAVSADVMQPANVSRLRPLDNLRAAERWWFG
ncbi:peptide ABC transporter substrate-binding protein [Sulfitobacter sp. M57]|uniref:ABC transporter substrate-binding protein n=1 Tax=unclassified Sulfitobacter TaxID=196795 RepID=UPI0023E15BF9|nr:MULTISPECIES: ABC transporter substrate-binding protein [unclassified Sulfitobacter]MDF3414946.1 peptide ABC transporter substrate-binding protein [Sulfitobacter sp. KE5]MDF3422427.1 peptide ABC transporter substrate-binding protein [Sulfitobacter sp. KE43]MDF3433492.1 peptide ABC transporter substrate-binding protein [Sulfitobacter sp. KE42]MDF3459132.1 peptide ABC transporter substrate-binding protein [Sulfitobacter sp. S74]MDF3463031.1 peptide ABC transporter substrate-binding protein [S